MGCLSGVWFTEEVCAWRTGNYRRGGGLVRGCLSGLVNARALVLGSLFTPEGRLLCCRALFSEIGQSAAELCDLTNYRWPLSAISDVWKKRIWTFPHVGTPFFYQIWWRYLDRWRIYDRKIEFETTPSGGRILLPVPISTRVFLWDLPMCTHIKFQANDTQTGGNFQCSIDIAKLPISDTVGEVPTRKLRKIAEPYFWSRIWWQILHREDGFLFEFHSSHKSISRSFGGVRVWHRRTDGQTDIQHGPLL